MVHGQCHHHARMDRLRPGALGCCPAGVQLALLPLLPLRLVGLPGGQCRDDLVRPADRQARPAGLADRLCLHQCAGDVAQRILLPIRYGCQGRRRRNHPASGHRSQCRWQCRTQAQSKCTHRPNDGHRHVGLQNEPPPCTAGDSPGSGQPCKITPWQHLNPATCLSP